jgi:hypothetical protein
MTYLGALAELAPEYGFGEIDKGNRWDKSGLADPRFEVGALPQ